ncbi:hypothetical protein [Streptomyces sp. NPDC002913]
MTAYWHPRQQTKHGGINPAPTKTNRIGESSSASRRYQDRVHEKLAIAGYVQLAPGVLFVYERAPWRIVEIVDRFQDWDDKREAMFAGILDNWEKRPVGDKPERVTWSGRPYVVVAVPDQDPAAKPVHLEAPAYYTWQILPEHYLICQACRELPPCRHEEAETRADREMARTEVLMEIPAGHCMSCSEHITRRQKSTRFPGPNLWRPDLPEHSAIFHAREECSDGLERYRTAWEARGGTRPQAALSFDDLGEAS